MPGGVFTAACSPDALHSLENGLILHCLKQLFDKVLRDAAKACLDGIVQKQILFPKQFHMKSYMAEFPRLLYKDGMTTISNISAGTKMGILFRYVLVAQTNEGYTMLHQHDKTSQKYGDMIHVFLMLLCYWAWLKKETYWDYNDHKALNIAKNAIWVLINRLRSLFPSTKGSEWRISKWHEQLHIAFLLLLYIAHRNQHTGPQEHNHIENTKNPSERTQKQKAVFDLQIANRLVDRYVIDHTHNMILKQQSHISMYEELEESFPEEELTKLAAKFFVSMKLNTTTIETDLEFGWTTPAMLGKGQDNTLLQIIEKLFFRDLPFE